ncbi:MAG: carbonate dehydratase [Sphingobacteriia bacterium]|nr:carbonate dehydratase [Sphingobacteriia bacterium]NCC39549.1 carbonate dehydratase [Gammaproteobacteria bacterium]
MKTTRIALMTLMLCGGLALAADEPHWGYSGHQGPAHWGDLDPHFGLCKNGQAQTPIDIVDAADIDLPRISLRYHSGALEEIHNGHTIQVNYEDGGSMVLDGHTYNLKQFHFHAPSENHIAGKEYPMEAHLVHADAEGRLAVIAVMFEEGQENLALANAWAAMPMRAGNTTRLGNPVSAEALLPANHDYYRFNGSLTTPPCTEGVTWLVMKHPASASHGQITKFVRAMGHANDRPIQSLNARLIQQ